MKLSSSQIQVLKKLRKGGAGFLRCWLSPYNISAGRSTLESLRSKGLVERQDGAGAFSLPRTGTFYRLTHAGEIESGKYA